MNNQLINPWIYYDALQMFTNNLFGSVRSILINNEPWFIGSDVAKCLGYTRPNDAIHDHVDQDDKQIINLKNTTPNQRNIPGNPNMMIINESGVYSLIFSSRLPIAKEFKHWVTSEVLPAMRRIGFSNSMRLLQEENERLKYDNQKLSQDLFVLNKENIRLDSRIKDLEMYNNNLICAII